ncbi:unnamed protein product [Phyllotreta striolata]|uniref:Uncharacterized protein n=1 Tax=Phyllotreta striolata TaxID=444603 RepID=A0A9N9XLT4_PHYSR|nr:unnamed protein product [Phyllotreta striolata]
MNRLLQKMKGLLVCLVLVASLTYAEENGNRPVLRRVTRQAINGMGGAFLKQTEANIILNCKSNQLTDSGAIQLQETFDKMKSCLGTKIIFSVPKDEYIQHLESCGKDAVRETENCLKSDQRYFPKFVLDLAKSLVNFMYDDKSALASMEVTACIRKFATVDVRRNYFECMLDASIRTHDTQEIPHSKGDFCGKFVPAGKCFPNTMTKYCDHNSNVEKFISDYTKSLETPCEIKEQ